MSDLFTQQSTMPELFKTGDDIAEELKAQTVEPNTATDLLLNGDSKPNRFSRQCAENEEPDADLTENLLHDEKSNKNTITGTNTPRSSRASAYYDLLRSQHKDGHYSQILHRVGIQKFYDFVHDKYLRNLLFSLDGFIVMRFVRLVKYAHYCGMVTSG